MMRYDVLMKLALWLAMMCLPQVLLASPASMEPLIIEQGGQSWSLFQRGDEHLHWHETQAGYPVGKDSSGQWVVIQGSSNLGVSYSSNALAAGMDFSGFSKVLHSSSNLRELEVNRWKTVSGANTMTPKGSKRHLVILAYFNDHASGSAPSSTHVVGTVAGTSYHDRFTASTNSLSAYYKGVSRNQMSITTDFTKWVALPKNEADYGTDGADYRDSGLLQLVQDAVTAASNTTASGLSSSPQSYDWLTVIHSGRDQARTSASDQSTRVWSTSGFLSQPLSMFGGNVQFSRYIVAAALGGLQEKEASDLGVLCHEVGHLLGLPDTDTYGDVGWSVGTWDLMGQGAWGLSGNALNASGASTLSPWAKIKLGWETPTLLEVSGNGLSLGSVQSSGEIYKLPTSQAHEYFLLESRTASLEPWAGFSSSWPKGLLIWHVYDKAYSSLSATEAIHPLLKLEEADGDDSIGTRAAGAEAGDLWSGNSILSAFTTADRATGSSKSYGASSFYDRSSVGQTSGLHLYNLKELSNMTFDLEGRKSKLYISDFSKGVLSWWPVHGATSYTLHRFDNKTKTTTSFNPVAGALSFEDTAATGADVDFDYTVQALGPTSYPLSASLHYGLLLESAHFYAHQGRLELNWNLPVLISSDTTMDLKGLHVSTSAGNRLFSLAGGDLESYAYQGKREGDVVDASYSTNITEQTKVVVHLSAVQRFEWIDQSNETNDNLHLECDASVARSLGSGNITNPVQTVILGSSVKVSSEKDIISPSFKQLSYSHDTGLLSVGFDEPLWFNTEGFDLSNFTIFGSGTLSTISATGANVAIHGNVLELGLSGEKRIKTKIIQDLSGGELKLKVPAGKVSDVSGKTATATDVTAAIIQTDVTQPYIGSFSLNHHLGVNQAKLVFSEPIFYTGVFSGNEFGFTLGSNLSTGLETLVLGGNVIGASDAQPTLDEINENFAGQNLRATYGVTLDLTEEEVDAIDQFYGLFANPAPTVYARLSKQTFKDQHGLLADVVHETVSNAYTPRRRARFNYPLDLSRPLASGNLIWKWKHQLAYQINGGWTGDEQLRIDWHNPNVNRSDNLIQSQMPLTFQSSTTSALKSHYSQIWDTLPPQVPDALGYQLRLSSNDGQRLFSTSHPIEVDNTVPQVRVSYISNSTPSHQVNADVLVDQVLYDFSLTPDEKNKTNVIVVATFTEPVIQAPEIFINQKGSSDNIEKMRSQSGGNTDTVFYFPYDVVPQNAGDHLDGIASVSIESVPDRAVGHTLAGNGLSASSPEIIGNKSLSVSQSSWPSTRFFSIDTIAPTVASLDFVILENSIVDQESVLEMYFSEDLFIPTGEGNTQIGLDGFPITGVLHKDYYLVLGTAAGSFDGGTLSVKSVEGKGKGPYRIVLNGVIQNGSLEVKMAAGQIIDFHGNPIGRPNSARALWPGPLRNRNEVLVSPGGRTRLLMSGGFPPYRTEIDPYYQSVARMADDGTSILGLSIDRYTISVFSRNQRRYVNARVVEPYESTISASFQAFRDELDFRMVSFPFNLDAWNGASLGNILRPSLGEMGADYALFTYDENVGYRAIGPQTTEVGPGYGFWMATRKLKSISVSHSGPLPEQVVGVDLHHGWNLVGNPFDQPLSASKIYVSTSGTRYGIDQLDQSETLNELWSLDIENPVYTAVNELQPFQGAWLYVNNPEGTELIFYRGQESSDFPVNYEPWPRAKAREAAQVGPFLPPLRPGSFDGSSRASSSSGGSSLGLSSSGGGGGGGCLLK